MSYSNESTTSSPDPLGMSHNNLELSSPLKQRRETPKLTPKKALAETSNNVRLHDIYLTTSPAARNRSASPKKGVAQAPISPWRIRVIVQAEPENEKDNTANAKHFTQPSIGQTTTTVIPLKEAGESVADSRRRSGARQQKLFGKRPGTPKSIAAGRRESTWISPEKGKNDGVSQIATTPKRSRGRPRKSLGGLSEMLGGHSEKHTTTAHVSPLDDLGDLGLLGEMTGPRRRRRRKAPTPTEHITYFDIVHQSSEQSLRLGLRMNEKGVNPQQVNGLKRKLDTDSAPGKAQRIKRPHVVLSSPKRDSSDSNKASGSASGLAQEFSTKRWLPSRQNTPSHPFSDPTDEHREFDSILESEGFSMISVSTLPSGKAGLNIAGHGRQGNEGGTDLETNLEDDNPGPILSPGLHQILEDAAEYRLEIPSPHREVLSVSAVENSARSDSHQTPSHMRLEPSNLPVLPPLVSQNAPRILDEVTDSTPKIIRVVRAGTVLQGVMGPQELADNSRNQEFDSTKSSPTAPEADSNNLFDGFGAGTQRELRAGLRLREELAKRLPGCPSQTSPGNIPLADNTFTHTENLNNLGSSSPKENLENGPIVTDAGQNICYPVISNPQLPSPDRSEIDAGEDQMSLDADTSAQSEEGMGDNHDSQSEGSIAGASYSSHNRTMEREAEWQREREAVVRQIEMANSSRVIIIDGDTVLQDERRFEAEEMEEMEDSDIWQAEARSSDADLNHSNQQSHSVIQTQVFKPRRSQIPSPWRRQDQLGPAVQGDVGSDLFWQPGRAASAGAETNEERNSSFDAPNHAARLRELLESSRANQLNEDSGSIIGPSRTPAGDSFRYKSVISSIDELVDGELDEGRIETQSPVMIIDTIERDQLTVCQPNRTVDLPRSRSSQISIHHTKATKILRPNGQSRTRTTSKPAANTSSISWLSYIASFVPGWDQPALPKPLPRLPNGLRRLPVAVSEGPLCLYLPWTLNHWRALYVHYAAAREGRATFRFNRFGPTAWHVGVPHRYRHWQKPITQEDSAIADAFLSDLRRRGVGTPPHNSVPIDDYKVLGMLFYIWKAGVMNGDCEVGVGKTGWQTGSEEWWRPDMESWYRG